jgi:hypothetical protein
VITGPPAVATATHAKPWRAERSGGKAPPFTTDPFQRVKSQGQGASGHAAWLPAHARRLPLRPSLRLVLPYALCCPAGASTRGAVESGHSAARRDLYFSRADRARADGSFAARDSSREHAVSTQPYCARGRRHTPFRCVWRVGVQMRLYTRPDRVCVGARAVTHTRTHTHTERKKERKKKWTREHTDTALKVAERASLRHTFDYF